MYKEKNFISAVVYVYNAEKNIYDFLKMLMGVLTDNFEHSEIICVNDFSSDKSCDEIKRAAQSNENTVVSLINMSYFHGPESAMAAGDDLAIGDFVFEFDRAVCDYDSSEIMNIYRKALTGYDIVSASADRPQKLSSSLFYSLLYKFSNGIERLNSETFRILSRRALNRIDSINKTIPYRKAVYANCGLKAANVKYTAVNDSGKKRTGKEKKYNLGLAANSLILFTDVGYRFSIGMACLMMVLGIFMAVYSFCIYFRSSPIEGWTTTILFMSAAFFGLFCVLAIIIKYLQIIVNLIFRRKQYSFESIEKLTK